MSANGTKMQKTNKLSQFKQWILSCVSGGVVYRYGTHYKMFYGRCYCIQKENFIGNWITIYETVNKRDWLEMCSHYTQLLKQKISHPISAT
jgi:hypothetical protein